MFNVPYVVLLKTLFVGTKYMYVQYVHPTTYQ